MLFNIELDISKDELAKRLGIPENDIQERGIDFAALYFDETDFDINSEEEYENVPTRMKIKVIEDAIHCNRHIDELIQNEINDEIYSRKKDLQKWNEKIGN